MRTFQLGLLVGASAIAISLGAATGVASADEGSAFSTPSSAITPLAEQVERGPKPAPVPSSETTRASFGFGGAQMIMSASNR